jgi:hypothetical protein
VTIDAASIDAMGRPQGIQQVEVTNRPPPPNFHVTTHVVINGVTDPEKIANDVAGRIGARLRDEMAGIYADTGHGVA